MPLHCFAMRTCQLNDAASRVASVLKFTRYEAIRRNATTTLAAGVQPGGANLCPAATNWCVWTDSNGDTNLQTTENQAQLTGSVNLVAPGNAPAGLAGGVGAGALTDIRAAGFTTFDQRGAVNPAAVDVLYVQNVTFPDLGCRAVIVLPSGSVQIWTSDTTGNWRQTN